jgi:hypothetical protein
MNERLREVRRRRHRREKLRKLRARLARASPAERGAIEAKILKSYSRAAPLPAQAKQGS